MNISTSKLGRNLVVAIDGEIDHHSVESIKTMVDKEFSRGNFRHIIFDFSKVSFMDSSGIGMIIGRYKNVEKQSGKVAIASMNSYADRIFQMSGLTKIISTYDSVEAAAQGVN